MTSHVKRVGIVLAAGDSTRNPNKLLLPAVHCESDRSFPMVTQALNWLWLKTNCDKVCLVVQEGSTVHLYAQMMRFVDGGLLLAYQRGAKGVVDAIQCGLEAFALAGVQFDECLVAFGDNAYDPRERVPSIDPALRRVGNIASVRVLQDADLDAFDDAWSNGHKWLDRAGDVPYKSGHVPHRLAGWLLLSSWLCKYLRDQHYDTLVEMLNTWHVQGVVVGPEYLWHDVGTPERYAEYLKACAKGGAND